MARNKNLQIYIYIVFCTFSFIIGIKCDLKVIINKIRKLRQKYKEEKTKTSKSGRARGRKWKFCYKMDRILGHRVNIGSLIQVLTRLKRVGKNNAETSS